MQRPDRIPRLLVENPTTNFSIADAIMDVIATLTLSSFLSLSLAFWSTVLVKQSFSYSFLYIAFFPTLFSFRFAMSFNFGFSFFIVCFLIFFPLVTLF